ncbi:metal ABC transporter permease, partial [Candidatus Babeliales bacterium]|nr:metal ABC transporter permease [Candidatus Babeliales bacterium]
MIFMFYVPMLITALATSIACATVGSLLLVRGMSFISDALGHAILLGIVISFLITKNIHSWWIFIGATMIGLFMIVCIEWLIQNKILEPDSAIGCIFPIFFAVAVLLINWYAQNIHLDLDAIFLGDLALIPFQMWT